jgi:hypothetical protein
VVCAASHDDRGGPTPGPNNILVLDTQNNKNPKQIEQLSSLVIIFVGGVEVQTNK